MPGDSQILRLGHFKHGNGTQITFWEDKWLDNLSFKEQYLNLYNIMRKKKATIDSPSEQHIADESKGYISLQENRLHSLIFFIFLGTEEYKYTIFLSTETDDYIVHR
jgi:hypothetical protein